jgi:hypothetical protein
MPGFNKLSSSACAVVSVIFLFNHSEVVAAKKIKLVAVKNWPDFDSQTDTVAEFMISQLEKLPDDSQVFADIGKVTQYDLERTIDPANYVGNGAFGTVYHFGSDVLKVVNVWKQADRRVNSLPDREKNMMLETMTLKEIHGLAVLQLFEEIFSEFKTLKDIENNR